MRVILAIAGVLVGVLAVIAIWLAIPKGGPSAPAVALAAPAQSTGAGVNPAQAAPVADAEAESDEGSLRVCNQTVNPVSIALGYRAERGWQSEGWWVAGPGECKTVYNGRLDARYYYVFAADDIGGGTWDGEVYMCTRDETFTIFGVEDCLARGYERTGFFEVDTKSRSNWTLQLTEGEVLGADPVAGAEDGAPLDGNLDAASGDDAE
ncbi:DUF1036 domain-containing protein [Devosia sp.]|uniref:DUF1036 domain-containing protein n=1 Tax=Devosia sp. TaxID=1871048 RepID=UPI002F028D3D